MMFTDLVCLLCIGDDRFSTLKHTRPFAKKDPLQKHLNIHVANGEFRQGFRCKHPSCSEWIEGLGHFKNYAAFVHGV
ncbi:uncharacterized protein BDR25DRAFT_117712 [Lindgomyces ingoldianus]|uniref:Uncharacterized protein n=1 Tax=Lindgomyces ingoldianus TaxID=673940 RepID=A0ACB6Q8Q8_9PLEO|nr:uncharacterized protein BDR25DRAFT_117712 [Lindgomyces ingoldianus]KAF2462925.1 hypothetical protein BDR25DRAFT_117712 [Lindgomyces ingoldianus]